MLSYQEIEIFVLVLVTLIYAMFDVFNKRNVPNIFVYATIGLGVALALVANSGLLLAIDLSIAAAVGLLGYLFYRSGLLGGGDVLEFVFIALVLPAQIPPFYSNVYQWNIPFILSVMIAAGYTSLLFHTYLLHRGEEAPKGCPGNPGVRTRSGAMLFAAYLIFILAIKYAYGISLLGVILILLLAISSVIIMVYREKNLPGHGRFHLPEQARGWRHDSHEPDGQKGYRVFQQEDQIR